MQTKANTENKAPGVFTATIQSTLLLLLTLFPVWLMFCLLHEGGHVLSGLSHGVGVSFFYAHPFLMMAFVSYASPPSALTVWDYAAGFVVSFIISLLLFIFLWRRRSVAILPFVLLFPVAACSSLGTLVALALGKDDFNQVINMTGWPAWPFFAIFSILTVLGIFLFVSCFPLLGLKPKDKRVFFVVPAGFLLWIFVSLIVAYLCVPGSRADVQFHMRETIISSAINDGLAALLLGVISALFYFTLYPVIERRLPVWLRTEKRNLLWRDLLIPGILSVVSIVVGILIIR